MAVKRESLFQLSDITFETLYLLKDVQVFCLFCFLMLSSSLSLEKDCESCRHFKWHKLLEIRSEDSLQNL